MGIVANDTQQLAMETTRRLMEYQQWPNTFFSGADARFYLFSPTDRKEITTVAAVAYNLEEQVVPIRSYNETKYRHIARGAKLVTGTIAVFYTERDAFIRYVNGFVSVEKERIDQSEALVDVKPKRTGMGLYKSPVEYDEPGVTPLQAMWDEAKTAAEEIEGSLFDSLGTKFNTTPFDLMVLIGAVEEVSKSMHILQGVDIVSYQTRVSNDGQPLVDEYQFIAKDYMSKEIAISSIYEKMDRAGRMGQEDADFNTKLKSVLDATPTGETILGRRKPDRVKEQTKTHYIQV